MSELLLDCAGRRRSPATMLGITSVHLQGIDNAEIIDTVHARRTPDDPRDRITAALNPQPSHSAARRATEQWEGALAEYGKCRQAKARAAVVDLRTGRDLTAAVVIAVSPPSPSSRLRQHAVV